MNHKKSRLTDLFRKMDKDNNGLIPRGEFIDGILNTSKKYALIYIFSINNEVIVVKEFDTSRMEMGAVADLFDRNGEGLIDWQEFIAALRPDWQERKPVTDSDKIHDEVKRLVMLCTCRQKFRVFQVGEGKYRVWYLNLLPILKGRSHNLNFMVLSLVIPKSYDWCVFYVVLLWYVLAVVGWP